MKIKPNVTITEIAHEVDRTERAIEMQIAKLKEKGSIKRIGPDKGGYWEIIVDNKD